MTRQKSPFSKPTLTRHDGFLRVTQQAKPLLVPKLERHKSFVEVTQQAKPLLQPESQRQGSSKKGGGSKGSFQKPLLERLAPATGTDEPQND